jgi:hypothetical protein
MPVPVTNAAGAPDTVVREPLPGELARVAHLFRHKRWLSGSRLMVVVRARPLERFVGAVAWWPAGPAARFQLAWPPGVAGEDVAPILIRSVLKAVGEAGLAGAQYADLLPESSPLLELMRQHGFERLRSERSFEVVYRDAWTRVMRLHSRCARDIPSTWRTDPIRQYPPEAILELVAPHRLLPPEELREYWRSTAAAGFDPELSCILFDRQRPFGVFLARRRSDALYIDVQVIEEPKPRLRSLADVFLLYHVARRLSPEGPIRRIQFRSGETEHRQTANLATRMGGRELPRLHVLGRTLKT